MSKITRTIEEQILADLADIKAHLALASKPQTSQVSERYYTPREVCERVKISRNTLEKFFRDCLITPIRVPQSRKIYIAESDLNRFFKREFSA